MKTFLLNPFSLLIALSILTISAVQAQDVQHIYIDENNTLYFQGHPQVSLNAFLDNSDQQAVSMEGDMLKVTDGGEVSLEAYMDNTDQQFMYKFGHTLFLQNGSQVNFDTYMDNTDEQTINAELVDNSRLVMEITNGNNVMVDLTPLVERQRGEIRDLTTLVQRMEDRIAALEGCACGERRLDDGSSTPNKGSIQEEAKSQPTVESKPSVDKARLFQNIPNPFQSTSSIKYFIPENTESAVMQFSNTSGKVVSRVNLTEKGNGELDVNSADLANGIYLYTLYVDGNMISTRKMVVK